MEPSILSERHQKLLDEEIALFQEMKQGLLLHIAEQGKMSYGGSSSHYADLIELRDSLSDTRMEDVSSVIAQMEPLALLSQQQVTTAKNPLPDLKSPYFAHLRIEEDGRIRDVLLGNTNCFSKHLPISIVDWKKAPVSRLFYRYLEGEEYFEEWGGKDVEGSILLRHILAIEDGALQHIRMNEGVLACNDNVWSFQDSNLPELHGGSGLSIRPGNVSTNKFSGNTKQVSKDRAEKHLRQITGLIDPQQFDIITRPSSGIILIQGGAGSGKTTVALHRMAYLLSKKPGYFRPETVLPIVFNQALSRYISKVLPALGIKGVQSSVFHLWTNRLRKRYFPKLPNRYAENTPLSVIELKRHPFLIQWFKELLENQEAECEKVLKDRCCNLEGYEALIQLWHQAKHLPLVPRILALRHWSRGAALPFAVSKCTNTRLAQRLELLWEEIAPGLSDQSKEVMALQVWENCFLQKEVLEDAVERYAPDTFTAGQIESVWSWGVRQHHKREEAIARKADKDAGQDFSDDISSQVSSDLRYQKEHPTLDEEDDVLLLLLYQLTVGPLRGKKKRKIQYTHLMVDEAQDFSPLELRLLVSMTPEKRHSVTLAGDMDQKIREGLDYGTWDSALKHLNMKVTEVEPLKIGYRSTHEIMEAGRKVMGDFSTNEEWKSMRQGTPVEHFNFRNQGELVLFLADALKHLMLHEPHASVAVLTRTAPVARNIFEGLEHADVPDIRYIRDQEFSFSSGIDVTDITQTKGLEFDYVLLVDVNAATFPVNARSRNLLYVGITRAAHQLWMLYCGKPSPLIA